MSISHVHCSELLPSLDFFFSFSSNISYSSLLYTPSVTCCHPSYHHSSAFCLLPDKFNQAAWGKQQRYLVSNSDCLLWRKKFSEDQWVASLEFRTALGKLIHSCPFLQQAPLRCICCRTFPILASRVWCQFTNHEVARAHAHFAHQSACPRHVTCLASSPKAMCYPGLSCSLLISLVPPHMMKEGSCFMSGGHCSPCSLVSNKEQELALVLSPNRGTNLAGKKKKSHHMSVITLTQTKLTCADRWKWSKARINFLGARKGSEGEWVPVGVQRGPSLSHLPAASAWWLHAFSTLCLKCAFNTSTW